MVSRVSDIIITSSIKELNQKQQHQRKLLVKLKSKNSLCERVRQISLQKKVEKRKLTFELKT